MLAVLALLAVRDLSKLAEQDRVFIFNGVVLLLIAKLSVAHLEVIELLLDLVILLIVVFWDSLGLAGLVLNLKILQDLSVLDKLLDLLDSSQDVVFVVRRRCIHL